MGSLLGINCYNFLCWMAEQTLGTQIWHCTSHVALYKSRGTVQVMWHCTSHAALYKSRGTVQVTWHCTSHVALILYFTSKAWSYCRFTLSPRNLPGVRIPSFLHTNKIKKRTAVKTPGQMPFQQQDWHLCFVGDHFYDANTLYFGLKEKGCKAYFSCSLEYSNKWYTYPPKLLFNFYSIASCVLETHVVATVR